MAKLEYRNLTGDFDALLRHIEHGILNGSLSASLEDSSDFYGGSSRCSVRVFERYSYMGSNRVSMNVTLYQAEPDAPIQLSAITSGGSQAMFFKINTIGEEALERLSDESFFLSPVAVYLGHFTDTAGVDRLSGKRQAQTLCLPRCHCDRMVRYVQRFSGDVCICHCRALFLQEAGR